MSRRFAGAVVGLVLAAPDVAAATEAQRFSEEW
jgi:hypothetical protein